jgi:hypothetical protein
MRSHFTKLHTLLFVALLFTGYACGSKSALSSLHDAATSTGGVTGTGGTVGAGGANATGGTIATGGSTGTSSPPAGAPIMPGCRCLDGTTTWDCYCNAFNCNKSLNGYVREAGSKDAYGAIMEYASCGLVVVVNPSGTSQEVYAQNTWRLVGEQAFVACPGSDAQIQSLKAGQFPDSTCPRSKCLPGKFTELCGSADAGAR